MEELEQELFNQDRNVEDMDFEEPKQKETDLTCKHSLKINSIGFIPKSDIEYKDGSFQITNYG